MTDKFEFAVVVIRDEQGRVSEVRGRGLRPYKRPLERTDGFDDMDPFAPPYDYGPETGDTDQEWLNLLLGHRPGDPRKGDRR
jgi:hypothetical protein